MSTTDFLVLINDNIDIYLLTFIFTIILYYVIFRKCVFTIIDPFLITLLYSSFATSVVLFLFCCKQIDLYMLSSFVFSQVALWLGYFVYKPMKLNDFSNELNILRKSSKFKIYVFIVSSFLYTILMLYTYIKIGIPLFMPSRLALFSEGGGIGFIGRVISIYGTISLFFLFYLHDCKDKPCNTYIKIYFCFYIVTLFLSGSKSTVLNIFIVYFAYLLCYGSKKQILWIKKHQYKVIGCVVLSAMIVILLQSGTEDNPILSFIIRLVSSGDVFYMSYPNKVILDIDNSNSLTLLFGEFLGTFRFVSWNDIPRPLGMQLFEYHSGYDASIGPNSRHNIIGLFVFGYYGGILFSFLVGLLVSYIRSKFFLLKVNHRPILSIFFIALYSSVVASETDITLLIAQVVNLIISFLLGVLVFVITIPGFILIYKKR